MRLVIAAVLALAAAVPASSDPVQPVRACAEWEPAFGTLVRYPFAIPAALVVELARDDSLYVLVETQNQENAARGYLSSNGVDLGVVRFIRTATYSEWTRDWGPHSVFDGDGTWGITDPMFNGYPWVPPGARGTGERGWNEDDAINGALAAEFDCPLHSMPAYCTGGNIMVDGRGIAFSSEQMLRENAPLWSESEFRDLARDYLGIETYHFLHGTEDYGIQHIDCWAKLLDEETILVKRPPTWHEEHPRIEANLQVLQSLANCYGRPYRIVRIDCPAFSGSDIAAYTNSLILNRKVLVPVFGIAGDQAALAVYRDAMPGYEVIGFPYSNWYYYDALHCRTMAIFDRGMLRIAHRPLDAEVPPAAAHEIVAMIDDRSEAGLVESALQVRWRREGETEWRSVPLLPAAGPDSFRAEIPYQPLWTTVEYSIAAADQSGRAETLPRTAPDGFYRFTVAVAPADLPDSEIGEPDRLSPPHPSPFVSSTLIPLPERAGPISLFVADPAGRRVRTLVERGFPPASGAARWDGRNDAGRRCAPGTYWVVLRRDGSVQARSCILAR